MPTNVNLQQIIINSIPTKEIYNQMKAQGLLEPNQLYLVEEDPSVADMSKSVYDANGVVQNAGGIVEYVAANGGKIDVIKINSTPVPIVDKAVDIDIPTELSELSDDATHRVVTDTEKAAWNAKGSYSKPSGGIPKTDLASGVQQSLSKADSALQSFTEADPTVPDWAKQPNKPSYIALEVGADPSGTAVAAVLAHDADANAHEELFSDCLKASDQEPSTPASINAAYIKTLKQGSDIILPRTKTNAISNQSGDNLDAILMNKADLVNGQVPSNQLPPMDFAPAGYGLGDSSVRVTGDWNDVKTNGWYRDESGTAERHSPFVGAFAIVLVLDYLKNGDTMQIAYGRSSGTAPKVYTKQRTYNADNGVWGEWEWANHHVSGILKGDGTGGVSAAVAGTDFAPAGYGLGGNSRLIASTDDLNNITANGWYYFNEPPAHAPTLETDWWIAGYSYMRVDKSVNSVTQTIYCSNAASVFGCVIKRYFVDEWYPWEWVNPAMIAGVAYRTTERRNGNPVYKKMDSNGVQYWSTDQTNWNAESTVKIETGSYVGTGTFGANNPNSITFSFKPKFVALTHMDIDGTYVVPYRLKPYAWWTVDMNDAPTSYKQNFGFAGTNSPDGKVSADGKTLYWYHGQSAENQFNIGKVYWIAIG